MLQSPLAISDTHALTMLDGAVQFLTAPLRHRYLTKLLPAISAR